MEDSMKMRRKERTDLHREKRAQRQEGGRTQEGRKVVKLTSSVLADLLLVGFQRLPHLLQYIVDARRCSRISSSRRWRCWLEGLIDCWTETKGRKEGKVGELPPPPPSSFSPSDC